MGLLFDVILFFYCLAVIPFLYVKGKWHSGFGMRLGFLPVDLRSRLKQQRNIWVHAVSVGEVTAVEGLLKALSEEYPLCSLVLSVTTRTGHDLAVKISADRFNGRLTVIWSPLDFSWTVRTFVAAIRPVIYVAAETELWPNLFNRLAVSGVPVLVINGRISDQAWVWYRRTRWLFRSFLSRVSCFAMQSEQDALRITAMGALSDRVAVTGNIKFDVPEQLVVRPLKVSFGNGRVLVAGSTHPGEEALLLAVFNDLAGQFADLRLVLAPRHPERTSAVAAEVVQAGYQPVLWSSYDGRVLGPGEILILDTIGFLRSFYSLASVVFVGKSLTVGGGHNIIEPAQYGKPVIVGSNMQNFRDITRIFVAARAVVQVGDARELKIRIAELLADNAEQARLGLAAKAVIQTQRGATLRILALIKQKMELT